MRESGLTTLSRGRYVYLVSIAFGAISIIAAAFLGEINEYMDDHVAVVM